MFYQYTQNNSGGFFKEPADFVIVEANSTDEANDRAEELGLYFDGTGDCSCCGYRWHEAFGEGDPEPSLYGEPVSKYKGYRKSTYIVYYLDDKKVEGKTQVK